MDAGRVDAAGFVCMSGKMAMHQFRVPEILVPSATTLALLRLIN
jgi:hypothetical protein